MMYIQHHLLCFPAGISSELAADSTWYKWGTLDFCRSEPLDFNCGTMINYQRGFQKTGHELYIAYSYFQCFAPDLQIPPR